MHQGPVARSLVSANRWLRGIKMYTFPWYLTLVSTNHASSNPGQTDKSKELDTRCGALSSQYGTCKCRVVLTNNTYRCSNTHLSNSRHRIASSLIL